MDKFRKGKSNFATTLVTGIGTGTSETITLNSTAGLPTDTEIVLTFNRVTSSGVVNPTSLVERIRGKISGSTLTAYTRGVDNTTEQAHSAGTVVEYIWSGADLNDLIDGILEQHDQQGFHKFAAPEGFLINGKIVPSVASNNLTVALKGLDGNDPSATNPIYVRIGDTVHSITSALSVTKNAGTNWFNAGSSELATKEIDYFVYLGYNATDGVVIGFSRIPYATEYSQFSTTSTNEKYCAISTITNAVAGDDYVVIGRFAATLSAGAGYTWSVPTFDSKNLIQRPIFETRTLVYVPTKTYAGGTTDPQNIVSDVASYSISGNYCYINHWVYSSNSGAGDRTEYSLVSPIPGVVTNSARIILMGCNYVGGTSTVSAPRISGANISVTGVSMSSGVAWESYVSGLYPIAKLK
jgi:hypothetical protein